MDMTTDDLCTYFDDLFQIKSLHHNLYFNTSKGFLSFVYALGIVKNLC